MTHYKLLKDINGAKEGTEFEYPVGNDCALMPEDILARLIGIDNDYFEKIEEKKSIYDLKTDEDYYFISHFSNITRAQVDTYNKENYKSRLSLGNVFITYKEAQQEINKRKAKSTIKKWSYDNDNGYELTYHDFSYFIVYDHTYENNHRELKVDNNIMLYKNYGTQYYSSEEIAERAVSELREEYNTLFGL